MGEHHQINVEDDSAFLDQLSGETPDIRRPYRVINPLFKNGQTVEPGDTIMLHPSTGQNFIDAGDVEPIEETP
jgi:hypothetical protein